MMEWVIEVIKQGPGAVVSLALIGTLYFVLVRHTKALDNQAARLDRFGERVEEAFDLTSSVLVALQQQLLAHDLTVSGLNPAAGATATERDSRALAKYTELQKSLDEMRGRLNARHTNGVQK